MTPEMAEEWYLLSGGNRPIRKAHVAFLAEEMKNRWHMNGEAIIFDWNGKLVEGHHRLVASGENNIAFETLVVRGVDPDAKATINTGRSRNGADALSFEGYTGSMSNLSSTIMRLIEHGEGRLRQPAAVKVSNGQIVKAATRFPGIADAVTTCACVRKVVAVSRFAWFYYLVSKNNQAKADHFINRLSDGIELKQDSPIYQLRQRLLNAMSTRKGGVAGGMALNEAMALIVKAWNLYFKGKTCQVLRWKSTEEFPKIEGL